MSTSSIKSISFTSEYLEELQYFLNQPNKSRYICELIRADIRGEKRGVNLEAIEKLIDEKLKNISISENNEISDNRDIRDNLIGLFGDI